MIAATGRGAPRLSIDARRMLPVCIGLSLVSHVLLLVIGSIQLAPSGGAAQVARAAPGRISVRLLQAPRPDDAPAPPAAEPAPLAAADPAQQAHDVAPRPAASAPMPMRAAASAAPGPALPASTDAFGAPIPTLPISNRFDYVPRPLLTVPPVPQSPILIEAPADPGDVARHVGVLTLFLNDQGFVDRIVAEAPALPPAMERAAVEAFKTARFEPGQLQGQVVKSKIHVEVVFDNTPLPGLAKRAPTSTVIESR